MTQDKQIEVTATGTLTFKDYLKHNQYHQRKIVIGYFITALLVLTYMCTRLFSGDWILIVPISFIIALIISGFFTLILIIGLRIRIRREYNSDQLIKSELTYIFDHIGITQKVRRSTSSLDWNDILVAHEHYEMFRLYISKNKAFLIPKRFFETKKDIILFKKLIVNNMNANKVKLM